MADDEPPLRKRARFFSTGKKKIVSMLKEIRHKKEEDNDTASEESESDNAVDSAVTDHTEYATAAGDVKFAPLQRGSTLNLSYRSLTFTETECGIVEGNNTESAHGFRQDLIPFGSNDAHGPQHRSQQAQETDIPASNRTVPENNYQNGDPVAPRKRIYNYPSLHPYSGPSMFNTVDERPQCTFAVGSSAAAAHPLILSKHSATAFNSSSCDRLPGNQLEATDRVNNFCSPILQTPQERSKMATPASLHPHIPLQGAEMHRRNCLSTGIRDNSSPFSALVAPIGHNMLDLDRAADGTLLHETLRRNTMLNSLRPTLVRHPIRTKDKIPDNLYTSPKRIENAMRTSSNVLKRKRLDALPEPPAYIYTRSGNPGFNVFSNGFLLYPELCFALALHLPLRDLISLYAVSRDFHTIIDSRFTTVCLAQALTKAPQSAQTFKFRAYAQYCRDDPAIRIPHPDPIKAGLSIARKIPSFRWVAFVLHREKVVHELITVFAERGCPLPARCGLALKRMWMLMDIPDNARRIALIHNHRVITDLDLYFAMCFFIKFDMVLNDPVATERCDSVRKLALSQRGGLDVILKVLKREMWNKKSDVLIAWVRTIMNLEGMDERDLDVLEVHSVLGVPRKDVGKGKYEYWGTKGSVNEVTGHQRQYLLRPDQLIMREAIRRGLQFDKHFLKCMLYGYVRPDTLQSYEPRKYGRQITGWNGEDYDINDSVGGLRALAVEDGGDPLLDLGNTGRGSPYTIVKEAVSAKEKDMRKVQDAMMKDLYEISEQEQRKQSK